MANNDKQEPENDQELIERLQRSDPRDPIWEYAVKKFMDKAIGGLSNKFKLKKKNIELAETAYLDAWIVMFEKIRKNKLDFREKKAKLSTYITTIAINKFYENLHESKRKPVDIPDWLPEEVYADLSEELSEDCERLLNNAIESISFSKNSTLSDCGQLIRLRYWEELSWKKIGENLNQDHDKLRKQFPSCKKALRKTLAELRFYEKCFNKF